MTTRRLRVLVPIVSVVVAAIVVCSVQARSTPAELAEARLLDRALSAIDRNYLDPARIDAHKMLEGGLTRIQSVIPEIMVENGSTDVMTVHVGLAQKRFRVLPMAGLGDLKRVMREVLAYIAENYHGETKPEEIEYAAIDGMLEVLDPHSNFMSPKVYKEFQIGTRGKFGGLGIVISIKDGQLAVVAPIEGTPAADAGIRAGDRILQIDDESTINMSLTDAVNKLRGDVGTKVAVIVERPGAPSRRIVLTRAIINIDSVQSKLLAEGEKRIGYVKVKSFQQNTDDDVVAALKAFRESGKIDGLILDLRNNPGGLLNVAVDLADHFLEDGVIVSTVGAHDQVLERENARAGGLKESAPVVVLVNEGSASASEIVAGALQANGRAAVMGRRTFGKGSVQTLFELGDGCALKLTIAQYKPAGTVDIQLAGLTPDVNLMPVTVDRTQMNLIEDVLPSEEDLESHLESAHRVKTAALPSSRFTVRYLQPKEDEKAQEAKSVREYQHDPDLEKDFAVTMARRFLAAAPASTRDGELKLGEQTLAAADAEQGVAISAALKAFGIDWSSRKAEGEPKLKLSYRLKSGKGEIRRARAGQKVELEFAATNVGTGPYARLIAIGQSDYPFLANLEFPFGALAAGESRSWSAPIEIPEGMPTEEMLLDVVFEEENRRLPQPLTAILPTEELPTPSFAFQYTLAPSGRPFATGTPVSLATEITNVGAGASSAETAATLSNDCGEAVFIENGRTKLGAMAPKAVRRAPFRFHLAGAPTEATCPLKLAIADIKRFRVLSKKLELGWKDGTIRPAPGKRYAPPTVEVTSAPSSTAETTAVIKGTIADTDRVRDYFVFAGEKKIAYVPNAGDSTTMDFAVTVPLEPGNTTVVIGARDETDLMTRKIVVIRRTSGERKKDRKIREATFMPNTNP